MRYADWACAWAIFVAGLWHIVFTEIRHPPGVFLDTGLAWIFLAMFNFLRLRNGAGVQNLRTFCLGANVAALVFEILRWKMYGTSGLFLAIFVLTETVFSAKRADDSGT